MGLRLRLITLVSSYSFDLSALGVFGKFEGECIGIDPVAGVRNWFDFYLIDRSGLL